MDVLSFKKQITLARAHLDLIRIRDLLDILLIYSFGRYFSHPEVFLTDSFLYGMLAVSAALFFTHIVNDISDIEIDRINKLHRPLVLDLVPVAAARDLAIFYAIISLVFGFLAGAATLIATLTLLFLGFAYSLKPFQLSRRGLLGTLTIILGYFMVPFFLGLGLEGFSNQISWTTFLFIVSLICSGAARLFLKDFRDVRGDQNYKKITPLGLLGKTGLAGLSCVLALLGWALFSAFTIFLPISISRIIIILLLAAGAHVLLIVTAIKLNRDQYTSRTHRLIVLIYYVFRVVLGISLLLVLTPSLNF